MKQVGTSLGGAGGFGAEHEDTSGFDARTGGQRGGQTGLGLRREARDGAPGRDGARDGTAARDAEVRARSFQDRIDDARRRLGRGPNRVDDHGGQAELAGLFGAPPDRGGAPGAAGGGRTSAAVEARQDRAGGSASDDRDPAAAADVSRDASKPWVVLTGADARGTDGQRRLLAAAEPPADALAALFAPRAAPASGEMEAAIPETGAPASIERRIADIADRVERAVAADLAASAGGPIALRIPLDGAGDGLTSLTVTATAQGLDVTLVRADGDAPSPELIQAAQGLAERLQHRLGRGSVRVFESTEAAGGTADSARPGESWGSLSAILGRGTG